MGTLQGHNEMAKYITMKWLLWAPARVTVKRGIDFMQRQKNADVQFQFAPSETCGGEIEKREVEGISFCCPFASLRETLDYQSRKLLERRPFPIPRAITEPPAWKLPPWPAGDTTGGQWREGKKSSLFASGGVEDFPSSCLEPVLCRASVGQCLLNLLSLSTAHCPAKKVSA